LYLQLLISSVEASIDLFIVFGIVQLPLSMTRSLQKLPEAVLALAPACTFAAD
jgi:hypothetical protein